MPWSVVNSRVFVILMRIVLCGWSHKEFEIQQYVNVKKQHSSECVQKITMSHLGGLDVSHVISQQLCEFQLLVRCYSALHFLQGHK